MAEKIYCLYCGAGDSHHEPGICDKCAADLELGRLVRGMKPGSALRKPALECANWQYYNDCAEGKDFYCTSLTPEEALRGSK